MRSRIIVRSVVLIIAAAVLLGGVGVAGLRAQVRSCSAAYEMCNQVAAITSPLMYLSCFEGYVFCKRFIEKS